MRFSARRTADSSMRPFIVVAEGELNPKDKGLLSQILGHFGLRGAKFFTPEEYAQHLEKLAPVALLHPLTEEAVPKPTFRFSGLNRRDQYMAREHFIDYAQSYEGGLPLTSIGRLFNHLVDGQGPGYWHPSHTRRTGPESMAVEPEPPGGIILAKREEVGLPPVNPSTIPSSYTKTPFCAPYAVQVGSFIDYTAQLAELPREFTKQQQLGIRMARQLQAQIESAQ